MANQSAKVTIEELPSAPATLEGVSTSSVATVGWVARGRTDQIMRFGSFSEFDQRCGSFWKNSYIPYSLNAFFNNGGQIGYIRRVVPADAAIAQLVLNGSALAAKAFSIGRTSTTLTGVLSASLYNIKIAVDAFIATTIDVTANLGVSASYTMAAIAANINAALTIVNPSLSNVCRVITAPDGSSRFEFVSPTTGTSSGIVFSAPTANDATLVLLGFATKTVAGTAAPAGILFTFRARGAGTWGNDIQLQLSSDKNYLDINGNPTLFDMSVLEERDGDGNFSQRETYEQVVLDDDSSPAFISTFVGSRSDYVTVVEGVSHGIPSSLAAYLYADLNFAVGNGSATAFNNSIGIPDWMEGGLQTARINRKTVIVKVNGTQVATDNGTGQITGATISSGTINYATGAVTLNFTVAPIASAVITLSFYASQADTLVFNLAGGTEGTGPITRSMVTDPALQLSKGGIYAFDDITDEVLNFILPDFAGSVAVHNDLIAYVETRKDAFVILDPGASMGPDDIVSYVRDEAAFNTSYAAIYWPWPTVADSLANGAPKNIPPSGFVMGTYARNDATVNVSHAPAGVNIGKMTGCIGFERTISVSDRDTVYPNRVNPFISERQTGRAVWGARTVSLDKTWRYIQARRFFLFAEKSIYINSWWSVFETIDAELYRRIKNSIDSFFLSLMKQGYFPSKVQEQSFLTVCDSTNNNSTNVDNGEVIIDVFLAVSKPGEFIRFRFRQLVSA